MTSVRTLRESFLSFFESEGHLRKASAPLVPENDPTLLFVNAGMVPFKNVFTGAEKADAARAVSAQKCLRAGGKHNDLDNVGYTARHHTFFEMLGNFSFGDYFKPEAIDLAWRFVTRELGLPPERLLVTVYAEDAEARDLWKKVSGLPEDRIVPIATSDNFWSMGETGPCGPSSEIFFDHGPEVAGGPPGSANEDGDRFIEIWNLVFMQYDQAAGGERTPLPSPSIDTGMGLERVAAVLQGVHNNYEIDLFRRLIGAAEEVYSCRAEGEGLASFRIIADHLRAGAFLIADGVLPSNEGRGYVLRRILRRAMRHAHSLGSREPGMYKLVTPLVGEMGEAYPELGRAAPAIADSLEQEEARFQRTLGRGLALLEDSSATLAQGDELDGDVAFKLYDTYGFPIDLTEDILRSRGIGVDKSGFDAAMERQRQESRENWSGSGDAATGQVWREILDTAGKSSFIGYTDNEGFSELRALVVSGMPCRTSKAGEAELVFAATPFYAESGGQAGDRGEIRFDNGARFIVRDVTRPLPGLHVHHGELVEGEVTIGDRAHLMVDAERRSRIMANHSATHLLHAALRNILGEHVTQKGSLVEEDRLRFDFSHGAALTEAEIEAIEAEVNAEIRQNTPTQIRVMAPDKAIEAGALALFGEKYGDEVRVLSMGRPRAGEERPYSVELCGGTHVERTGDIAIFVITTEQGVSAGVRRLEAATGAEALAFLKGRSQVAGDLADQLKVSIKDLPGRVNALAEDRRRLERENNDLRRKLALAGEGTGGGAPAVETIGATRFIGRVIEGVGGKELRTLVDEAKAQLGSGVVAFVGVNDGKAAMSVGVTRDLTGEYSAVELVRLASAEVGGKGGGGRADMAQAGGPDGSHAQAAIDAVRAALAD
ncbi:MAG: alanine--tRNA ligase [Alphaproteobacteria bacterium]|nr:alanine--tRNA ligase [Alphaproteobacteria bacterium]